MDVQSYNISMVGLGGQVASVYVYGEMSLLIALYEAHNQTYCHCRLVV